MDTYKNDIILIAGSGDFAFEAANYLNSKNRLNQIILLNKNSNISKLYKNMVLYFDIRDIENLIKFIKKRGWQDHPLKLVHVYYATNSSPSTHEHPVKPPAFKAFRVLRTSSAFLPVSNALTDTC